MKIGTDMEVLIDRLANLSIDAATGIHKKSVYNEEGAGNLMFNLIYFLFHCKVQRPLCAAIVDT